MFTVEDLNFLDCRSYNPLINKLKEAQVCTYTLEGAEVYDAVSLWRRLAIDMPYPVNLPYPQHLYIPDHWQAFADYIRFGLLTDETSLKKAFIWNNAHVMLERGLQDLCLATTIFARITFDVLVNTKGVYDVGANFYTFFLGNGPNFPLLITNDTVLIVP